MPEHIETEKVIEEQQDAAIEAVEKGDVDEVTAEVVNAEIETLRAALKKANAEAAERRKKLKLYEDAEHEREEAAKSELQKAQEKAQQLEQQLAESLATVRKTAIRHAVEVMAMSLGFASAEDAYELADLSSMIYDEASGKVKGVEEVLKELLKKKPYLTKQAPKRPVGDIDAHETGSGAEADVVTIIANKRSDYSAL